MANPTDRARIQKIGRTLQDQYHALRTFRSRRKMLLTEANQLNTRIIELERRIRDLEQNRQDLIESYSE